jgi:putative flippase GtrA
VTAAVLREPRRLARFIVVGACANISLFVLSYVFRSLGVAAFVAGAGAYAITFVAAYAAQRGWTFGSTESHARVFPRYLAAQIACAALSGLVGHVAVEIFALSPLWMSVAVTAVAAISSFFLSSLWVFAKSGEQPRG